MGEMGLEVCYGTLRMLLASRPARESVFVKTPSIEQSAIRDPLQRVVQSETFNGANRLTAFLAYVVEETLAGRQDMIRAKRIAADVYDRPLDEDQGQDTLVRVDAGRLRRRLSLYYAGEGQEDPVRISIPSGGYAPEFEQGGKARQAPGSRIEVAAVPSLRPRPFVLAGGLAAISALVLAGILFRDTGDENAERDAVVSDAQLEKRSPDALSEQEMAANESIFEKSPSALLAESHIQTARDLIYPPLSPNRVSASLELCEEAKSLDPLNPGGYSCASRAKGFQAFLMEPGPDRTRLISTALADARSAIDLDPTISYPESALACATYLSGDFDTAMELAHRATLSDPEDELSRNYYGMMASFGGDFERILAGPPGFGADSDATFSPITVTRALFHTGAYEEAIAMVKKTAAEGGQTSNFMLAILAAWHQALGHHKLAKKYAKELIDKRPRYKEQIRTMYRLPENTEAG
jgi:tetratricopeptide (TPR) repeat protein